MLNRMSICFFLALSTSTFAGGKGGGYGGPGMYGGASPRTQHALDRYFQQNGPAIRIPGSVSGQYYGGRTAMPSRSVPSRSVPYSSPYSVVPPRSVPYGGTAYGRSVPYHVPYQSFDVPPENRTLHYDTPGDWPPPPAYRGAPVFTDPYGVTRTDSRTGATVTRVGPGEVIPEPGTEQTSGPFVGSFDGRPSTPPSPPTTIKRPTQTTPDRQITNNAPNTTPPPSVLPGQKTPEVQTVHWGPSQMSDFVRKLSDERNNIVLLYFAKLSVPVDNDIEDLVAVELPRRYVGKISFYRVIVDDRLDTPKYPETFLAFPNYLNHINAGDSAFALLEYRNGKWYLAGGWSGHLTSESFAAQLEKTITTHKLSDE